MRSATARELETLRMQVRSVELWCTAMEANPGSIRSFCAIELRAALAQAATMVGDDEAASELTTEPDEIPAAGTAIANEKAAMSAEQWALLMQCVCPGPPSLEFNRNCPTHGRYLR